MSRLVHVETLHDPHAYNQAEAEEMLEVYVMLGRDPGRLVIVTAPEDGCDGCSHCQHMRRLEDA